MSRVCAAWAYTGGALPASLQAGLARFLERWSARGVSEIDPGVARWREDPTQLLASVMSYVSAKSATDPEHQFQLSVREGEAMVAELARRHRSGPA